MWCTSLIPELKKKRQTEPCDFKDNLAPGEFHISQSYIIKPCHKINKNHWKQQELKTCPEKKTTTEIFMGSLTKSLNSVAGKFL